MADRVNTLYRHRWRAADRRPQNFSFDLFQCNAIDSEQNQCYTPLRVLSRLCSVSVAELDNHKGINEMDFLAQVQRELAGRNIAPAADHELVLLRKLEAGGVTPINAAIDIARARHPRRRASPTTSEERQSRLMVVELSKWECDVIAKGIGMLLASGFAPVHARRLLEKLIKAAADGPLRNDL